MDVVGPLPPSSGHRYLFTNVNCSIIGPEAVLMAYASSPSCTTPLFFGWMARFGISEHITSDRGTAFTSVTDVLGTADGHRSLPHYSLQPGG